MSNNLRVIYNNLVNSATIVASSEANATTTNVSNLKKDTKSLVWRAKPPASGNIATAGLIISFPTNIVGGIIIPFCNLTATATIRVRCFTGTTPTYTGTYPSRTLVTASSTKVYDSEGTTVLTKYINNACPYEALGLWDWGSVPLGVNSYSYGGGTYARYWLPKQVSCTSVVIEIEDTGNPANYIEASRLIIGSYWSPKYNASFGMSTNMKDLSIHERTEAGDLVSTVGTKHNSMTFDLKYMTPSDKLEFMRILKGNGMPKPLFISLFPNDENATKEQTHQIYGKLSQLSAIQLPIFDMYSTSIDIEEI